jgi:hypothetical protein
MTGGGCPAGRNGSDRLPTFLGIRSVEVHGLRHVICRLEDFEFRCRVKVLGFKVEG